MHSVLLVEDDEDVRDALADALEVFGVEHVVACASLAEVERRAAEALRAAAAFVDVNLGAGEPTGVDVARWLEGHGFHRRIVFLTAHAAGYPELGTVPRDDVFSKPVPLSVLQHVVEGA